MSQNLEIPFIPYFILKATKAWQNLLMFPLVLVSQSLIESKSWTSPELYSLEGEPISPLLGGESPCNYKWLWLIICILLKGLWLFLVKCHDVLGGCFYYELVLLDIFWVNELLDSNQGFGFSFWGCLCEAGGMLWMSLPLEESQLIPQGPSKGQEILTHLFSTDKGQTGTIESVVIVC